MKRDNLNISMVTDLMNALNHYTELVAYFPQLERGNEHIAELCITPYHNSQIVQDWDNVNIHVVPQTWGSTACGWGGMGGSAITTTNNYVFEQVYSGLVFVYWGGKLAYIAKKENIQDFGRLPSMSSVVAIYKNNRR